MTVGGRLCTHVVNLPAMGYTKGLTDRSRLALMVMATIARDEPTKRQQAAVYYAGWGLIARGAFGFPEYDDSAHRAVARAIAELTSAHLIEPQRETAPGQNQVYRLTLPELGAFVRK